MVRCLLSVVCGVTLFATSASLTLANERTGHQWVDISDDKQMFDKNCDYKVWLLEEGNWRETWYLEAFDAENAFYTITRKSSAWTNEDDFYALNYKDKTKFLTETDITIDVVPFKMCIHDGK